MSLLEFRRWRATPEGALEFGWHLEAWGIEAAERQRQQKLDWSNKPPSGRKRAVHFKDAG